VIFDRKRETMSTDKKSQRPSPDATPDPATPPLVEPPTVEVADPEKGLAVKQSQHGTTSAARPEEPASGSGTPVHNDGTPLQEHQVRTDGTPGAEPPMVDPAEGGIEGATSPKRAHKKTAE
jgi:hypothetical protein